MGQVVQRIIRDHVRSIWPNVQGLSVLGLGYAVPVLDMLRAEAARVICFMPAQQGVSRWPVAEPNLTGLVDDNALPLPDVSIDRVLLMHELETAEAVRPLLREIWRILSPSGRLLVVTPNRLGLWARAEATPFGHGRPYSRGQLIQLMRDHQFDPQSWRSALFFPPANLGFLLRTAHLWERINPHLWPRFPGLHMVEVGKQIYAMTGERRRFRMLRPVPVVQPGLAGNAREQTQ